MALIRGYNPIWFEVDLTAHPFDDTFYLFVLENTLPYLPATVWHDPFGDVPWTDPIRFLANGTLPNDIYFDPGVVYRLEFRQGPSQDDPLIYLVENYDPGNGSSNPEGVSFPTDNQITNPQFSLINFRSPLVITGGSTQTIEIAPGWFLDLTGTGNATIAQQALNSSTPNPTNAPYALHLTLGAWSTVVLRQRFSQNGIQWANKYVSSSVTARIDGSPQNISAILKDSMGATLASVLASTPVTGAFTEYTGYALLEASTNTDTPPNAYIEYQLILPSNVDIYLTSFQIVSSALPLEYKYEQDTIERQIDQTFHYYKDPLSFKPIPSWTLGWDFRFNPCQELGRTVTATDLGATNKSRYIADQTIAFEPVRNALSYTFSNGSGLAISTTSSTQCAIIQYLDARSAIELLSHPICSQARFNLSGGGSVTGTLNLYWTPDTSLPDMPITTNHNSLVATMSNGAPATFNGNWNPVLRGNLGIASFTLTNGFLQTVDFSGFDSSGVSGIDNAKFFAIVIGFNTITSAQTVVVDYCTLQSGSIPTPPPAMSYSQTLTALESYYEVSWSEGVTVGTATFNGAAIAKMNVAAGGAGQAVYATAFSFNYNTPKRVAINPVLYPTQTASGPGFATAYLYYNGVFQVQNSALVSSNWVIASPSTKIGSYQPTNFNVLTSTGAGGTTRDGFIGFHYILDARFGVV